MCMEKRVQPLNNCYIRKPTAGSSTAILRGKGDLAIPRIVGCWRNGALSCLPPSPLLRETSALSKKEKKKHTVIVV